MTPLERILGLVYVSVWSVSMYPPLLLNWRRKSARALSLDFAVLNAAGYTYLLVSMVLQYCSGDAGAGAGAPVPGRPLISAFDMWYCGHGFALNLVLLSQLLCGRRLWGFDKEHTRALRMQKVYLRVLLGSVALFTVLSVQFGRETLRSGWDNEWDSGAALQYCNRLYALKISMSLVKYVPQVLHNRARRSVEGFSIQGVALDVTGGVASLLQLFLQLARQHGVSLEVFVANFGKIGIAVVTLVFNCVFVGQWLLYRDTRGRSDKGRGELLL